MHAVPGHLFFEQHVFANGKWFREYIRGGRWRWRRFDWSGWMRPRMYCWRWCWWGSQRLAARYFGTRAAWMAVSAVRAVAVLRRHRGDQHVPHGFRRFAGGGDADGARRDGNGAVRTIRLGAVAGVYLAAGDPAVYGGGDRGILFCALMIRHWGRSGERIRVLVLFAGLGIGVVACMAGYNRLYAGDARVRPYAAVRGRRRCRR